MKWEKIFTALLLTCLMGAVSVINLEKVEGLTRSELAEKLVLIVEDHLSAEDLYRLGQQYETGDGVVQWYAKALAYYQAAETAGWPEASTAVNNLNSYKEAVIASGDQGEIFTFYRTGIVASQKGNYEQAFAIYYDDSFFFEDPQDRGLGGLADLYLVGNGVVQDVAAAMAIYEVMAAEQGKGNGYTALGNIYMAETGTYPGVSQSNDTALHYYLLSFQDSGLNSIDFKGPRYAGNFYDSGFYHDDGTWEEPNYILAESYYLIAVAGNGRTFDGTSAYKLGNYYETGLPGIVQDYAKAVQFYEKALSDANVHSTMLGIPDTYLSLGHFYENGLGVPVDIEKALAYYYQAQSAAQDNLELGGNVAGYEAALKVYETASTAIQRLTGADSEIPLLAEEDKGSSLETDKPEQHSEEMSSSKQTISGTEQRADTFLGKANTRTSVSSSQGSKNNATPLPLTGDRLGILSTVAGIVLLLLFFIVKHRKKHHHKIEWRRKL